MRLFFLFFVSLFLSHPVLAAARTDEDISVVKAHSWYPDYVTFLPLEKQDSVLFYADSEIVPIIFDVNRYDFKSNSIIDDIVSVINHVLYDKRVSLSYVWVGGSASPDGPYKWNMKLGEKRANALAEYILENTALPSSKLIIENLGEDWFNFEKSLSAYPYKDSLMNLTGGTSDPDEMEKLLRIYDNGRSWPFLLKNVFPGLRCARIVIVCSPVQLEPVKVKQTPLRAQSPEKIPGLENKPVEKSTGAERDTTIFLSLKTNLAFWGGAVTNLSFEVGFGKHWSVDMPVYYSPYDLFTNVRKIRMLAVQPELRYWIKDAGQGHFVGIHGHLAGFNVAVNDKARYQDPNRPMWGLGLGYGYALNFGKSQRWGIEFNIGLGFADYQYDAYRNWENGPKFKSGSGCYWGLTRAGITLFYRWYVPRKHR